MSQELTKDKKKGLTLTIRATNGATWTAEFKTNDKVIKVAREAEEHFVEAGDMAAGDYLLAIVEDNGQPRVLNEASKLEDEQVPDNATLVLVSRNPQVDG